MVQENSNLEEKLRDTYSYEDVVKASTAYFGGEELAASTWATKYSLKDSSGKIYELTPRDMHKRLAKEFARIESKYQNPLSEEKIFSLMDRFKYIIPQGSPMSGIGNDFQTVSLSNCFVIGNESDSYGGIIRTDEEQVQLMKRRGGVGHDLSHLRPKGNAVANSALNSTGMATFMGRYSSSTREVAQDGRRGALMLTTSIKHPDSGYFIDAKIDPEKVTGANISVRISDEFMKAVIEDKNYTQQFPIDSENPSVKKEIKAKDLWKKIVHNAWASAEPGILFWDTIIKNSIPDCYVDEGFKTVSTNPCGEIPLCVYDSCRLLAINLYSYVDKPFTKDAKFNFGLFKEHAGYAQRLMDDLVDLELEKIDKILYKIESDPEREDIKSIEKNLWKKIKEKAIKGRRTGLGITAEGDMLAALGMRYGSDEATEFSANAVHKTLALEAYRSSVNLAKERGGFPIYNSAKEEDNPFIQRIKEADEGLYSEMTKHGRRNIALLTIAPTGSVSIVTQTTSGLENVFLPAYIRKKKINPNDKGVRVDSIDNVGDSWQHFPVFHHKFETWLKINGYDVNEVKNITDEKELNEIVAKSPYYKATSVDVDWVSKVKMQGAVQKWNDHSISVTVNLPENVSEETVGKVYQTAWESGCKGITVYRDGSRSGVLVTNNSKKESELERISVENPLKVPGIMPAVKIRQNTHEGNIHMEVVTDPRNNYSPVEIFAELGNAGTEEAATMEALGRLSSYILRTGGQIEPIIAQLKDIGSGVNVITRDGGVQSLPMGFARGLMKFKLLKEKYRIEDFFSGRLDYVKVEEEISDILRTGKENEYNLNALPEEIRKGNTKGQRCPECHEKSLIRSEGCEKCMSCGYSKC